MSVLEPNPPSHDRAQHRWMALAVILAAILPLEIGGLLLVLTGNPLAGIPALTAGLTGAAKLLPHLRPDHPA